MATTMFSSVAVHAEGDDEGEIYMLSPSRSMQMPSQLLLMSTKM